MCAFNAYIQYLLNNSCKGEHERLSYLLQIITIIVPWILSYLFRNWPNACMLRLVLDSIAEGYPKCLACVYLQTPRVKTQRHWVSRRIYKTLLRWNQITRWTTFSLYRVSSEITLVSIGKKYEDKINTKYYI